MDPAEFSASGSYEGIPAPTYPDFRPAQRCIPKPHDISGRKKVAAKAMSACSPDGLSGVNPQSGCAKVETELTEKQLLQHEHLKTCSLAVSANVDGISSSRRVVGGESSQARRQTISRLELESQAHALPIDPVTTMPVSEYSPARGRAASGITSSSNVPSSSTVCSLRGRDSAVTGSMQLPTPRKDHQRSFDRAKRLIVMAKYQIQSREEELIEIAREFNRDAMGAAHDIPKLLESHRREPEYAATRTTPTPRETSSTPATRLGAASVQFSCISSSYVGAEGPQQEGGCIPAGIQMRPNGTDEARVVRLARHADEDEDEYEYEDEDGERGPSEASRQEEATTDTGSDNAVQLRLVNAGGLAGGIKAVHPQLGLFLKTPDKVGPIYSSAVMAAKVMKLERNANRWIHEMDSVHVNAPLSTVVDVPVEIMTRATASSACETVEGSVTRVLVQARLQIGSHTLRVGSSDAGRTLHVDALQMEDVVDALATRFHLAPIEQAKCTCLVRHSYLQLGTPPECGASAARVPNALGLQASSRPELGDAVPPELGDAVPPELGDAVPPELGDAVPPQCEGHALERDAQLERGAQLIPCDWLAAIQARGTDTTSIEAAMDLDVASASENAWVKELVSRSGAHLDIHQQEVVTHAADTASCDGTMPLHPLPFDVEVHQLASGQRMVLDSHRLLIPDMAWIDWMRCSAESVPRVWAIHVSNSSRRDASGSHIDLADASSTEIRACSQGQLPKRLRWPDSAENTEKLCHEVAGWIQIQRLSQLGESTAPQVHVHVLAQSPGSGQVLLRATEREGTSHREWILAVSCPIWYFGRNPALTCMLPPEASGVLRSMGIPPVAPDSAMQQGHDPGGIRVNELVHTCASLVTQERLADAASRILQAAHDVHQARDAGVSGGCKSAEISLALIRKLRLTAKQVLHSLGLGLRHSGAVYRSIVLGGQHAVPCADDKNLLESVLLSCSLPRAESPAGSALTCLAQHAASALPGIGSTGLAAVREMILAARAFSAKGLWGCKLSVWTCFARAFFEYDHEDHALSRVESSQGIAGIQTAVDSSSVLASSLSSDAGPQARRGIEQLLREIAHVQAVGGAMESRLLHDMAQLTSYGGVLASLAIRGLVRLVSMLRLERPPGTTFEFDLASLGYEFVRAGFVREALGFLQLARPAMDDAARSSSTEVGDREKGADIVIQDPDLGPIVVPSTLEFAPDEGTLRFWDAIGRCLLGTNASVEALSVYRKLLEAYVSIGVKPTDRVYANVLNRIACCHVQQGDYELAAQVQNVCCSRLATPGYRDRNHLAMLHFLGVSYRYCEDQERAFEAFERCRQGRAELLGMDHPEYLETVSNVVACATVRQQSHYGIQLLSECCTSVKSKLGQRHPTYIRMLCSLGNAHAGAHEFEKALVILQKCLVLLASVAGTDSVQHIEILQCIAKVQVDLGHLDVATSTYQEVYRVHSRMSSHGGRSFLHRLLLEMARLEQRKGNHEQAVSILSECEVTGENGDVSSDPVFGDCLWSMSESYQKLGRSDESIVTMRKCYEERKRKHGDRKATTLRTLCMLAKLLHRNGDLSGAASVYAQCREAQAIAVGETSDDYVDTLYHQAMCAQQENRYSDALSIYNLYLQVQGKRTNSCSSKCSQILVRQSECLAAMGRHAESCAALRKSVAMCIALFGDSHANTMYVKGLLARESERATMSGEARGSADAVNMYAEGQSMIQHCVPSDSKGPASEKIMRDLSEPKSGDGKRNASAGKSPEYASELCDRASSLLHADRREEALDAVREFANLRVVTSPEHCRGYLHALNRVAMTAGHLGEMSLALCLFQRCHEQAATEYGEHSLAHLHAGTSVVTTHLHMGNPLLGIELAAEIHDAAERAGARELLAVADKLIRSIEAALGDQVDLRFCRTKSTGLGDLYRQMRGFASRLD